jgi:formylmethanofuran dehydrogenase subunit C
MSALTFRLKQAVTQRIDMSPFTPQGLSGMGLGDMAHIPLWLGNRQLPAGELFEISGDEHTEIVIQSDSDRLDRIGTGMSGGSIRVEGNAGAYLGCGMRGGILRVSGDAGLAAGCAMSGGRLRIDGDAGDFLGGAVTGERQGMRGGTILVKGSAGDRAGDLMRRGTLLIGGDAGDYCASRMVAGTIAVLGKCGAQSGLSMRRGSLLLTREPTSLPASFNDNGRHDLAFLPLLTHSFQDPAFAALRERGSRVQRWLGDLRCGGMGEILIW